MTNSDKYEVYLHGSVRMDVNGRLCRDTGWPCITEEVFSPDLDGEPDFYDVYLRTDTPDDPQQPFDITHEREFKTIDKARRYASELCEEHGLDPDDFEEY